MPPIICPIVRWIARGTAFLIAAGFLAFVIGEPVGSLRVIQFREWVGMVLLFGAVAGMLLAWKWEFPAALISLFALVVFAAVVHMQPTTSWPLRQFPTFCSFWIGSCGVPIPRGFRRRGDIFGRPASPDHEVIFSAHLPGKHAK
jgi:hypothetical protein